MVDITMNNRRTLLGLPAYASSAALQVMPYPRRALAALMLIFSHPRETSSTRVPLCSATKVTSTSCASDSA